MLEFNNTSGDDDDEDDDDGADKPGAHECSARPQGVVRSEGVAPPIGRGRTLLLFTQTQRRKQSCLWLFLFSVLCEILPPLQEKAEDVLYFFFF